MVRSTTTTWKNTDTAIIHPLGYWTAARPETMHRSNPIRKINEKYDEAFPLAAQITIR
jgi:hypothetical protein